MRCPYCDSEKTRVVDKRTTDSDANRRRRECTSCGKRFTTYERLEKALSIKKIRKRDGRIVAFDQGKITEAIFKAAKAVGGKDRSMSEKLSNQVIKLLEEKFKVDMPSVEDIQDVVEYVLIENGHAKTAKAYILYRAKHKEIRATRDMFVDVDNTIGEYLEQTDWRVRENSNEQYSFSGLLLHISGKMIANYALSKIYTPQIAEAHEKGYVHIHDLSHGFIGYCCGHSLKNLLLWGFGGVPNKVDARPAKHMSTVVHQMVNYIGCLQMEFAGAQAFSSVDTLLAPFIRADKMSYKEVKQCMQQLVYSLNIPSRWGCFSEDTEISTIDGWKKGIELKVGDVIATFNMSKEEIEYLPVLKMTIDHYSGKMYNLKNRIMDQLVTPNHKVLRRIHNYNQAVSETKYVLEEAQKLTTKIPLIPLGGSFNGLEFDTALVKSLAWIISEGSLCRNERICIHQSAEKNPEKCEDIRIALDGAGIPFDEQPKLSGFTGKMNCMRFRLNRPMSNKLYDNYFPDYVKKIPDDLRHLSTKQARLFIDTYMEGDGWSPENKIYTKSRIDADILQEMITKAGWGSTLTRNKNGIYVIRVVKHDCSQITSIEEVDYDGVVWCPTTTNNTAIVRRKGKVFISGNSQYPFSNLTFDWVPPEDMKNEGAIVGGEEQEYTYGDLQKEMDMINRAFIEVMLEGDANGRVFTFPIPTYNLTKDFDWDGMNANLLFEMTAKYGLPYFQNYIGSNLDPKSIRAMCCRLNLDLNQLIKRPGHIFAAGDSTGSLGVVTINLNRLGYEAKTRKEFFEKLEHYMGIARDSLEIKRRVVNKNLENGLMPYTKRYLGTFANHFSTIGLCGMNEACLNLTGKGISSQEGKQLAIDTLTFMRDRIVEFQKETGNLCNLEATPAESTAYRFGKLDKQMYPDIITAGENEPYLTNSTHLPVNFTDDPIAALEHQNDIQPLYTGGTIFHAFLGEKMSSGGATKQFVKKIAENTAIPYFTITPTFSVCPDHGYINGEHFKCPKQGCENECEVYSRVVGYYRPVQNWNDGKQEEFKDRIEYLEGKGLKGQFNHLQNGVKNGKKAVT